LSRHVGAPHNFRLTRTSPTSESDRSVMHIAKARDRLDDELQSTVTNLQQLFQLLKTQTVRQKAAGRLGERIT
jgi:hypothetical protein